MIDWLREIETFLEGVEEFECNAVSCGDRSVSRLFQANKRLQLTKHHNRLIYRSTNHHQMETNALTNTVGSYNQDRRTRNVQINNEQRH